MTLFHFVIFLTHYLNINHSLYFIRRWSDSMHHTTQRCHVIFMIIALFIPIITSVSADNKIFKYYRQESLEYLIGHGHEDCHGTQTLCINDR